MIMCVREREEIHIIRDIESDRRTQVTERERERERKED